MKAFVSRSILAALLVSGFASFSKAQTTPTIPKVLGVSVSQRPDLGANGFGISASASEFLKGMVVTAPDGTIFPNAPGTSPIEISSLTLAEVVGRFAGEWTIKDPENLLAGTPAQYHHFSLSALDLSTFPAAAPTILSPPNGAVLLDSFNVESTGIGLRLRGETLQFATSSNHIDFDFFVHRLPLVVEARALRGVSLLVNSMPVDPSPVNTYHVLLSKNIFSAPVTWTFGVPEPGTGTLAGLALIAIGFVRRR